MKKHRPAAPKIVSVSTARRQFGQIMRRAKNRRERFIVTYRGEPKAVIVGVEEFITIVEPGKQVETFAGLRRDKGRR
jgi:prevent-host-death family protein